MRMHAEDWLWNKCLLHATAKLHRSVPEMQWSRMDSMDSISSSLNHEAYKCTHARA